MPGPLTTRTGALRGDDAENGNYVAYPLEASDGHHGHSSPRGDGADNLIPYVPEFVSQAINAKWAKGSSGPAGGEIHNMLSAASGVRRLTPVECERLQAWPDNWTDPSGTAPDSRRYAAAGDGVTATVSEWIGRRLVEQHHVQRAAGAQTPAARTNP